MNIHSIGKVRTIVLRLLYFPKKYLKYPNIVSSTRVFMELRIVLILPVSFLVSTFVKVFGSCDKRVLYC